MHFIEVIIFSIIQGVTEFLPVSSSAHLKLLNILYGINNDMQLSYELAAHFGTIFAVIIYFWSDCQKILLQICALFHQKTRHRIKHQGEENLLIHLIIATIPILIIGLLIQLSFKDHWRNSIALVGWMSIIFGLLLQFSDTKFEATRKIKHMNKKDALFFGLAQSVAIIPGVSRSGITVTMGRFLNMERHEAARFSMLMAIPTLLISSAGYSVWKVISEGGIFFGFDVLLVAFASFFVALLVIHFFMSWLKNSSFFPFVIYRIILGIILVSFAYGIF